MNIFKIEEVAKEDSLSKILLDKNKVTSKLSIPNDSSYYENYSTLLDLENK